MMPRRLYLLFDLTRGLCTRSVRGGTFGTGARTMARWTARGTSAARLVARAGEQRPYGAQPSVSLGGLSV